MYAIRSYYAPEQRRGYRLSYRDDRAGQAAQAPGDELEPDRGFCPRL